MQNAKCKLIILDITGNLVPYARRYTKVIREMKNGNERRSRKSKREKKKKTVAIIFLVKNDEWLREIYQEERTSRI